MSDPVPLTPEELERLEELCQKATPGPWIIGTPDNQNDVDHHLGIHVEDDGWVIADMCSTVNNNDGVNQDANAAFIAAARTALPALLHEVRQSWQALNDAVTILDHNKMLDGSYQVTKQDGRRLRIALGIEPQKGH